MAMEASFAVNLFPDGFGIDRPTEKGQSPPLGYEVMDWLCPYDRSSESFLTAIDGGWLPSDMLDEIPCTYVDGSVLCEIRDYRDCLPSNSMQAMVHSSVRGWAPKVEFLTLQPTVGSIIKDVARMADETWSYTDLLEMESRILNVVRPPLSLHPSPAVAKKAHINFYDKWKLNPGCRATRKYRTHSGAVACRRLRSAAKKFFIQVPDYVEPKSQNNPGSMVAVLDTEGRINSSYQQECVKQENQENLEFASSGLSKIATDAVKRGGDKQSSGSPSPSTPGTPLANLSGNLGSNTSRADCRLESASLLGKRESRESLGGRYEEKKVKQEQVKAEKVLPHQHQALQKVEAKHIKDLQKKEKQQFHQRPAMQLSIAGQRTTSSDLQEVSIHDSSLHSDPKSGLGEKYDTSELIQLRDGYGTNKAENDDQHAPVSHQQQGMKPDMQDSLLSVDGKFEQASMTWGQKPVPRAQMPAAIAQTSHPTASPLIPNSNPILGPPLTASVSQVADRPGVNGTLSTLCQVGAVSQMEQSPDLLHLQGVRGRIVSEARPCAPNSLVKSAGAASPVTSPEATGSPVATPLLEHSASGQWAEKVSPSTVALLTAIRSQNLHINKKKPEELPAANTAQPSWQLLLVALEEGPDKFKDQIGSRKLATSLVAGSVNTRKNRVLMFQRLETVFQGQLPSVYHRSRISLHMNQQRPKDQMVEAWILIGDEHDDESQNTSAPHQVLPTTPTMGFSKQVFVGVYALHEADRYASQFCDLLIKEGYELIEDEVFATTRPAASNACSMSAGATTLGNLVPVNSPRVNMTRQVQPMIGGSQILQPSSPSSFRMPPPGNFANRQLLSSHLGQSVVGATAKPVPLDRASLLAVQHHHQLVQQHQLQGPQASAAPSQLAAQMTGQPHSQQLNTPMVGHSPHLQQLQFLHQHHQQQQQQQQHHQQQQHMMQRQLLSSAMGIGGMNGMSNINGPAGMRNLVGLNGINGISGMTTMSPVTGPVMGLPGLTNMGINALTQNSVGNLMNPQLRQGSMTSAQALSSNNRIVSIRNRTGTLTAQAARTLVDSFVPLAAAAQLQGPSGITMGQSLPRANLSTMQRTPAAGMASQKGKPAMSGVAGQSFSINAAPNPQQLTGQQLTAQQHLASQPLNSTLNVGALGSLVGGAGSPQMGTQSFASVTGLTAAMDLQGNTLMTASVPRGRIRSGQPGQSLQ